ncbi:DegT/DnrJ/EryC1/StrS family aminotransferase [Rhodoferax saidenbachensis]|uniref:dTDP-4-amino-4,6-dideoxygalactose transaminase n=1 Tax=Rhodoferax saidenbachensis TaxID=1484693 RepID=A0ABU1ZKW7_9BURK|nr:DegT/DnrJ/EryC1/StrS family aminotransferase [Rhodoferax saidenbachensis]MDR7306033.1 dTDP-4-amino-4,6-dideoxygalactose transaminase [Rhodoferax saidenbachensis]
MNSKLAILGGEPAVKRPLGVFNAIGPEEKAAVVDFLDKGTVLSGFHGSARPSFFGGEQVQAFEAAWSARFKTKHSISVNSATSGLMAAMGAIGIGPGDEVIVPPYTMTATAVAPLIYGGIPVFVDIDPDYFCLDPVLVEKAITPATKAIIAVNLFGHPAELTRLRALADAKGLYLIEDNAQAVIAEEDGKLAGTIGHIGIYSLNVHKHIQVGEGGVCVTASDDLALRLQLIRNHGENVIDWLDVKELSNLVGFNYRMTEITAAMARAQLKKVDVLVERVERVCHALTAGLSDLPGLTPPKVRTGCRHNYYMWSARFDAAIIGTTREKFSQALEKEGFPNAGGYVRPIYQIPMFQRQIAIGKNGFPFNLVGKTYSEGLCLVTEKMHKKELLQFQPVSWDVDEDQVAMLIEAVRKVYQQAESI